MERPPSEVVIQSGPHQEPSILIYIFVFVFFFSGMVGTLLFVCAAFQWTCFGCEVARRVIVRRLRGENPPQHAISLDTERSKAV